MHLRHFALIFVILALVFIPSTAKMFDLGNYTIDTGSYLLPHDAAVVNGSLSWHRIIQEFTTIIIENESNILPGFVENTTNMSDAQVGDILSHGTIFIFFRTFDDLKLNTLEDITNLNNKSNIREVSKPYPGYLALSISYPKIKVYAGSIDRFNILYILSSESDDSMAAPPRNKSLHEGARSCCSAAIHPGRSRGITGLSWPHPSLSITLIRFLPLRSEMFLALLNPLFLPFLLFGLNPSVIQERHGIVHELL